MTRRWLYLLVGLLLAAVLILGLRSSMCPTNTYIEVNP